jgi:hypothetical protein
MKPSLLLSVPLFALSACAFHWQDDSTKGQSGKLTFQYVSSQCGLGCALDRPVVENALITIQAHGVDPSTKYTMDVQPSSLGTLTSSESCFCESSSGTSASSRSIDPSDACGPGETKSCVLSADVQTLASGVATLRVIDPSGAVVDTAAFTIAAADQVKQDVTVAGKAASAGSDGAYAARTGDKIQVHSTVLSAGKPMVFTRHGLEPSYSDPSIVAYDPSVTIGATDIEYAIAKSPGTATVTMSAVGARGTVTLHVSQ